MHNWKIKTKKNSFDKLVRLLVGEVEKLARLLDVGTPSWIIGTPLARWYVGKFIGTLARRNEKLVRFWHFGALARGHVDHAGKHGTHGMRFSKLQ